MDHGSRRAVLDRLSEFDEVAEGAGVHLPTPVARTSLHAITGTWRELLLGHQPDESGRCRTCSGLLRRRRWPCRVWVLAHEHLVSEDGPAPRPAGRRRGPQVQVIDRPRPTTAEGRDRPDVSLAGTTATAQRPVAPPAPPAVLARAAVVVIDGPDGSADSPVHVPRQAGGATVNVPQQADGGRGAPVHRAAVVERVPTLPRRRPSRPRA